MMKHKFQVSMTLTFELPKATEAETPDLNLEIHDQLIENMQPSLWLMDARGEEDEVEIEYGDLEITEVVV